MREAEIRRRLARSLERAGVADPAGDARRLFDWAYAAGDAGAPQTRDTPNDLTIKMLGAGADQRMKRRPVSQITGRRAFWRHEFQVSSDVLDPRPETETLIELALSEPFSRLLDLGTGSGCIAISLLADRPNAVGTATDIDARALEVARGNARRLGVADRLDFGVSDWVSGVVGRYDLIVSNPPYIAETELAGLSPEVRDWEPRGALTDGADGLSAYRALAAGARDHLTVGGRLLMEIGPTQATAVSGLLHAAGFEDVAVHPDLDGRDRVVSARAP